MIHESHMPYILCQNVDFVAEWTSVLDTTEQWKKTLVEDLKGVTLPTPTNAGIVQL